MDRLRARITDKRVLALVKAFLKAGIMTADGDAEETRHGHPAAVDLHAPNARGNFCFEVTLGYRRVERGL